LFLDPFHKENEEGDQQEGRRDQRSTGSKAIISSIGSRHSQNEGSSKIKCVKGHQGLRCVNISPKSHTIALMVTVWVLVGLAWTVYWKVKGKVWRLLLL
jgi:hypothetical protein